MIKVLLADDHQVLLDGLQNLLKEQEDIECVGMASNGKEVIDFLSSKTADVILMDINMPEMDGIETTKKIQTDHPDVKVIALTMLEQGSFVQLMLKYGARGFLLKNAGKDQVISAIKAVAAGGQYLGPLATQLLFEKLKGKEEEKQQFIPRLTRRENEVLRQISLGKSTKEIGVLLSISFNTVESYRKNLLTKFGAKNGAALIRMAAEKGML